MRQDGPRLVVQTWLGSRLVMVLVALFVTLTTGRDAVAMFTNWDVRHFLHIATVGYGAENNVAFFPGWPLILRGVSAVGLPMLGTGIVLCLGASVLAAWALYRLGGERAGAVAAIAWLIAPTAVFTAVPYTESVFCAAAFWAWERATSGRWWQAALLAAAACSFRVSGLFLIGALAVLAVTTSGERRERLARLSWLLIPAAVLAGYAIYLYVLTGSWTAWYSAQAAGWNRGLTPPWVSFMNTLDATKPGAYPDHPEWSWVFRAEVLSMAFGLIITLVSLWRRRWGEAAWVGVQVLAFSLSYWFLSVNRAVLLWFPLWLLVGEAVTRMTGWAAGRGRVSRIGVRTVIIAAGMASAVVMVLWAWLFFTSRWSS